MSRLPKLRLPTDDDARRRVLAASELARDGDIKGAQQALKEAVSSGAIPSALQRQVLAWWSAGSYDLEGQADGAAKPPAPREPPRGPEAQITRVMKEKGMSHAEAAKFIDEGGLEMEEYQREQNRPMEEVFEKMKAQGPPQWFVDMFNKTEAQGGDGGEAGLADAAAAQSPPPGTSPVAFAPACAGRDC
mmetsp:Transcript_80773/g.224813  ORF Transcript_80773/g.224813 Transcript_80773/m.224813 type:complete len:189 (+) Transcript_80773:83-649(+)